MPLSHVWRLFSLLVQSRVRNVEISPFWTVVTPDLRFLWETYAEVRSSAACAKRGGQLTQHLPCCLCAHSTMSLSLATEYSLRAQTALTTFWKPSSQPRPLEFLQTPLIRILIRILICPSLPLPANASRIMGEVVGVKHHTVIHTMGMCYLCVVGL